MSGSCVSDYGTHCNHSGMKCMSVCAFMYLCTVYVCDILLANTTSRMNTFTASCICDMNEADAIPIMFGRDHSSTGSTEVKM